MTSQASKALLLQIGTKWLPRTSRKFHPGFGWIALSLSLSIFFLSLSPSLSPFVSLSFSFFHSLTHFICLLLGFFWNPNSTDFYLYLSIFDKSYFQFFSLSLSTLRHWGPSTKQTTDVCFPFLGSSNFLWKPTRGLKSKPKASQTLTVKWHHVISHCMTTIKQIEAQCTHILKPKQQL